jgi:hypothetical protein
MRTIQYTLQLDSCRLLPEGSAHPHDPQQKGEQTLREATLVAYSVQIPGPLQVCPALLGWFVSARKVNPIIPHTWRAGSANHTFVPIKSVVGS